MSSNGMNDKDKNPKKKYDLEERTARFGERIIEFAQSLPVISLIIGLLGKLSILEQVLVRTTWKLMLLNRRKTSGTKSVFARKNQKKQNIGYV